MRDSNQRKFPEPLIHSDEFGPFVQAAIDDTFDSDRLEKNRIALNRRLSELIASGSRGLLHPQPLAIRPVAAVLFVALLMLSAGASGYFIYKKFIAEKKALPSASEKSRDRGEGRGQQQRRRSSVNKNPSLVLPDPIEEERLSETSPKAAPPRRSSGISPWDTAAPEPKKNGSSALNEQVRLFDDAKRHLRSNRFSKALKRLNELDRRFPESPLSRESKELRARSLAGLGRNREAAGTVRHLLEFNIPTRKKAQLLRFLGDLQVRQGQCEDAVESYRRALGLGLPGAESSAAKAGIRQCSP
jgi:TolA-binding protein